MTDSTKKSKKESSVTSKDAEESENTDEETMPKKKQAYIFIFLLDIGVSVPMGI